MTPPIPSSGVSRLQVLLHLDRLLRGPLSGRTWHPNPLRAFSLTGSTRLPACMFRSSMQQGTRLHDSLAQLQKDL